MAKKIYVITEGEYSDYHICGVYDDKEKAQAFIDSFGTGHYYKMGIEEYTLNPFELDVQDGRKPYFLRMTKAGRAYGIEIKDSYYGFQDDPSYGFDCGKNLYNYCFARDDQHAIKITNELRARLIAENKWPKAREDR